MLENVCLLIECRHNLHLVFFSNVPMEGKSYFFHFHIFGAFNLQKN